MTSVLEREIAKARAWADRWVPPRRLYTSQAKAMTVARGYAGQTLWRHRVSAVRGGFWRVSKLDQRIDPGPGWAKPLGAVRMTIDLGGGS